MSESNSRTQPRNLKVAYGGYVWKFPRKISTSPKAVETRFEGTQSRADAVKFASRIHYANPLPPPPPPPPGHLRPLPPFNRERREEEEEEGKVSRFQQLRFTGCRNIITMSSSPAVVSMSTVSIPPSGFVFKGMISSLRRGSHLATVSKLSMLIAAVTELSGRSETIR